MGQKGLSMAISGPFWPFLVSMEARSKQRAARSGEREARSAKRTSVFDITRRGTYLCYITRRGIYLCYITRRGSERRRRELATVKCMYITYIRALSEDKCHL